MQNFIKRIVLPVFALAVAVCSMGIESCDSQDIKDVLDPEMSAKMQEPPQSVVSIHNIIKYRRGDSVHEAEAQAYYGPNVTVTKIPLITINDIEKIEAVPRTDLKGMYDLKLFLTDRGRKLWIGLSTNNKNIPLAFLVDGMFYRQFTARLIHDDVTKQIIIDGPFDQATALEIQNESVINHRKAKRQR